MTERDSEGASARLLPRFLATCALFLLLAVPVFAQALPLLSGRVVDDAGILSPETEAQLTAMLEDHERQSSDQIVVATIDTTDGEPIENYANRLFRHWGLGQAQENNGVLLLVSVDDRTMRIEVGYGLEGTLTDLLARLIIDDTIVPRFRAGDYGDGIRRGLADVIAVLSGDSAELEARARRNAERGDPPVEFIIFVVLFLTIGGGMFGFAFLASIYGKKLGPGRYEWLGVDVNLRGGGVSVGPFSAGLSGRMSGGGGSSSGGGFSGGGGSSGGGGASGGW